MSEFAQMQNYQLHPVNTEFSNYSDFTASITQNGKARFEYRCDDVQSYHIHNTVTGETLSAISKSPSIALNHEKGFRKKLIRFISYVFNHYWLDEHLIIFSQEDAELFRLCFVPPLRMELRVKENKHKIYWDGGLFSTRLGVKDYFEFDLNPSQDLPNLEISTDNPDWTWITIGFAYYYWIDTKTGD